ncbi:MAG: riboflavin synthase [Ignavibacteriales bacterium]
MFTGLVEEVGTVKSIKPFNGGLLLGISALKVTGGLKLGDSININGACQTVTAFDSSSFEVTTVEETIKKTNLAKLKINDRVNLERSLTLDKRLGGHFVMGHVDTTGKILNVKKLGASYLVNVSYPREFGKYLINVGAIAVEGISLTVARFDEHSLTVSIIPHTWKETNLEYKGIGADLNLEFDVLGKYVAKLLNKEEGTGITESWLRQNGY